MEPTVVGTELQVPVPSAPSPVAIDVHSGHSPVGAVVGLFAESLAVAGAHGHHVFQVVSLVQLVGLGAGCKNIFESSVL